MIFPRPACNTRKTRPRPSAATYEEPALTSLTRRRFLQGFRVWSLLDNFEWAEGYEQRWAIVNVDFETESARRRSVPGGTPR